MAYHQAAHILNASLSGSRANVLPLSFPDVQDSDLSVALSAAEAMRRCAPAAAETEAQTSSDTTCAPPCHVSTAAAAAAGSVAQLGPAAGRACPSAGQQQQLPLQDSSTRCNIAAAPAQPHKPPALSTPQALCRKRRAPSAQGTRCQKPAPAPAPAPAATNFTTAMQLDAAGKVASAHGSALSLLDVPAPAAAAVAAAQGGPTSSSSAHLVRAGLCSSRDSLTCLAPCAFVPGALPAHSIPQQGPVLELPRVGSAPDPAGPGALTGLQLSQPPAVPDPQHEADLFLDSKDLDNLLDAVLETDFGVLPEVQEQQQQQQDRQKFPGAGSKVARTVVFAHPAAVPAEPACHQLQLPEVLHPQQLPERPQLRLPQLLPLDQVLDLGSGGAAGAGAGAAAAGGVSVGAAIVGAAGAGADASAAGASAAGASAFDHASAAGASASAAGAGAGAGAAGAGAAGAGAAARHAPGAASKALGPRAVSGACADGILACLNKRQDVLAFATICMHQLLDMRMLLLTMPVCSHTMACLWSWLNGMRQQQSQLSDVQPASAKTASSAAEAAVLQLLEQLVHLLGNALGHQGLPVAGRPFVLSVLEQLQSALLSLHTVLATAPTAATAAVNVRSLLQHSMQTQGLDQLRDNPAALVVLRFAAML